MSKLICDPDSFKVSRLFFDDANYPRGFNRSGDYSMSEAQILEQYGVVLLALSDGSQQPKTDEEKQFVEVAQGKREATSKIEKSWVKYLQKTQQPKKFHTLFGSSKVEVNEAEDSPGSDESSAEEPIESTKIDMD